MGYAIDMYKILHYILKFRKPKGDEYTILSDVFKIQERGTNSTIYQDIVDVLTYSATFQETFFDNDGR